VVIDLESTNGTFVGGSRVRGPHFIDGGVIHLGSDDGDIRIELLQPDKLDATLSRSGLAADMETKALDPDPPEERLHEPEEHAKGLVEKLARLLTERDAELSKASRERDRLAAELETERSAAQDLGNQLADRKALLGQHQGEHRTLLDRVRALESERADLRIQVSRLTEEVGQAMSRSEAEHAQSMESFLRALVEQGASIKPADPEWDLDKFLIHELVRFLRSADHLVRGPGETRLAAILNEISTASPVNPARRQMLEYLGELREELETRAHAYPAAIGRFVEQLRDDLSERGLTRTVPIPAFKQLSGLAADELWKRASRYMKELSGEVVDHRIRELALETHRAGAAVRRPFVRARPAGDT
jgi:pSer/pThr/pTyr-binding forkhead associated (FHA) protein